VIDAEGREIPWNQVSRINQDVIGFTFLVQSMS
jgi:hypothetical protein